MVLRQFRAETVAQNAQLRLAKADGGRRRSAANGGTHICTIESMMGGKELYSVYRNGLLRIGFSCECGFIRIE